MSYTDLAQMAQQQRPQPQPTWAQTVGAQPGMPPQQDPAQLPPDPRSFSQAPTNPAARSFQMANVEGGGGVPAGLETNQDLGDATKQKEKQDQQQKETEEASSETYPPVFFPTGPYVPPSPNRTADQWATKGHALSLAEEFPYVGPTPDMPTPYDSWTELVTSGKAVGMYGPDDAARYARQASFLASPIAAILDAFSKGTFSRNYSNAALRGIEIRAREAQLANEQSHRLVEGHLLGAADVFKRLELNFISPAQAEQELRQHAWGNPALMTALNNHDLRGAYSYLQWLDAQYRRQLYAGHQLKKVTDPNRDQNELDALGGRAVSPTGEGAGGLGVDPAKLPGPEGPTTPTAPAVSTETGTAEPATTEDFDKALGQKLGQPPDIAAGIIREAHRAFNGQPIEESLNKQGQAARLIGQARMAIGANIDKTANAPFDPNRDTAEQSEERLARITKYDPETGKFMLGLRNLQIDPNDASVAGQNRQHAITLMTKLFPKTATSPGWNRDMFHQFHAVWNNEQSNINKGLGALNRASSELTLLSAAINKLPGGEDQPIPLDYALWLKESKITGDAHYAALNEPLRTLATDVVTVNNMGGRAAVTPVNQLLAEAPKYASKRQLRMLVHQIAGQLNNITGYTIDTYHNQTGLPGLPSALDEKSLPVIDAVARGNPNTGRYPANAPAELKSIEPKERSKRLKEGEDYEPLDKTQYEGLRATIDKLRKDNPNDPRLPQLLHELGVRQ